MKVSLKAARINAELTRPQAAKALGVSLGTVLNWEIGKTYPDALWIKELQRVYGVSYDDLIFLPRKDALSVNEHRASATDDHEKAS